jgi:hypothetical protein
VNPEKLAERKSAKTSPGGRGVEIISHFSDNDMPYTDALKLV